MVHVLIVGLVRMKYLDKLKTFFGPRRTLPEPDISIPLRTTGRDVIKELLSKDHKYRVQIYRTKEGMFTSEIYQWDTSDWIEHAIALWIGSGDCSITDTIENAEKLVREDLKDADLRET